MAPETYTLDAAITAWAKGSADIDIRRAAAAACAKYQKSRSDLLNYYLEQVPGEIKN